MRAAPRGPARPSWRRGAPLRSPERSRGWSDASCGAHKLTPGSPPNDGFRAFNQVTLLRPRGNLPTKHRRFPIKHGRFSTNHGRFPTTHGRFQPGAAAAARRVDRRDGGRGRDGSRLKVAPNYYTTILQYYTTILCSYTATLLPTRSGSWLKVAPSLVEGTASSPTPANLEATAAPVHSVAQP